MAPTQEEEEESSRSSHEDSDSENKNLPPPAAAAAAREKGDIWGAKRGNKNTGAVRPGAQAVPYPRSNLADNDDTDSGSEDDETASTFLSPQEIQDNRTKQNELERRQIAERVKSNGVAQLGAVSVTNGGSKNYNVRNLTTYPSQGDPATLDANVEDPQEVGSVENIDLETANMVDDAETIHYASDVTKDNFRRKFMIGALIVVALALSIGLGVGLSRDGTPECLFGDDDPCCNKSYPSEEYHRLCCYPFEDERPASVIAPLSCFCFNNTDLVLNNATLYNETLYNNTRDLYVSRADQADDMIEFNRSSCDITNQAFLMFSNTDSYNNFVGKRGLQFRLQLFYFVAAYLYASTNGTAWKNSDNWFDSEYQVCDWFGLECLYQQTVSTIALPENGLSGTIPFQLGLLTSLRKIDFSDNDDLGGTIPPRLFDLTDLTSLSLDRIWFSGTIPNEIGNLKDLSELSLPTAEGDCGMTGTIPPTIFHDSLRSLDLSGHNLKTLPTEVGQATNLYIMRLQSCGLEGSITEELGKLTKLKLLDISKNNLDYTTIVPPSLGNLTSLDFLNVFDSGLNETVTDSFCDNVSDSNRDSNLVVISMNKTGQECKCKCCTSKISQPGKQVSILCREQPSGKSSSGSTECPID